jgi:hypothetical protein
MWPDLKTENIQVLNVTWPDLKLENWETEHNFVHSSSYRFSSFRFSGEACGAGETFSKTFISNMQNQVLELLYSNIIHLCKKNSQSNLYKQSVYTETNFSIFSISVSLFTRTDVWNWDVYFQNWKSQVCSNWNWSNTLKPGVCIGSHTLKPESAATETGFISGKLRNKYQAFSLIIVHT